ncbi:glycoside hydrolase [Lophiotrema nucula]|uniref:lytic cellulose monooxygenase (C4-dehydrogenating) n=1 Tax=Lophiotrema nucula TaxID=690887 RepID=A0A6A5Z0W7_9PLEO|nr:glycoside hydrolase [Lophiotrema nucula]
MKFPTRLTVLLLNATGTTAHYFWPWFIVNGTQFAQWKYVRDVAGAGYYSDEVVDKTEPQFDLYSTNFTCGRLAFASAEKTETADVLAGSLVGFRVHEGLPEPDANYSGLQHPGPAQAYLARVPQAVSIKDFSGIDGEWFKIAALLAETDTQWVAGNYDHRVINFTLPATTPPGKYLLRFEQFWPSPSFLQTQFYVNCAQINVINHGAAGSLDGYPFAKFPGAYDYMDTGIWAGNELGNNQGLLKYVAPGPAVWKG